MRRECVAIVAGLIVSCSFAGDVRAQDAGRPARDGGTRDSAAAPVDGTAAPSEGQDGLPPGHPSLDDEGAANPHAHAAGNGAMPGMFQPPEDVEQEDGSLPPGTIAVDLHDADDRPVPQETVNLGILVNSIAKGDSRRHLQATTDDHGRALFSQLDLASNIAYRVSAGYQGGLFAALPFQLQQAKAMRVVLHVYPVTHDVQQALIVAEATVAAEVRDDRIQVEEALTIYNLGRTAWQPDDVRLSLPDGYTAFNAQASMSDQGVDDVGGAGRLRGTFPPGRHSVDFRWQVPWSGDSDVDFDVGLPPHVAIARVMMPATSEIQLMAKGFPPSEARHDSQGQSFLVTERRVRPEDPKLTTLGVGIHGLPASGPGKWIASMLAASCVLLGLVLAFNRQQRGPAGGGGKSSRTALLDELLGLERARESGEVGPKTYERARREIIDALARTLART